MGELCGSGCIRSNRRGACMQRHGWRRAGVPMENPQRACGIHLRTRGDRTGSAWKPLLFLDFSVRLHKTFRRFASPEVQRIGQHGFANYVVHGAAIGAGRWRIHRRVAAPLTSSLFRGRYFFRRVSAVAFPSDTYVAARPLVRVLSCSPVPDARGVRTRRRRRAGGWRGQESEGNPSLHPMMHPAESPSVIARPRLSGEARSAKPERGGLPPLFISLDRNPEVLST